MADKKVAIRKRITKDDSCSRRSSKNVESDVFQKSSRLCALNGSSLSIRGAKSKIMCVYIVFCVLLISLYQ